MNTKEAINILNTLSISDALNVYERSAINEAIMQMEHIKRRNEEQDDFQGWPVKKLTMKELRKFVRDNGALDDDVKLLVLKDDGMGYGAVNGYCSDIYVSNGKNRKKEVQIWF